MIQGVTTGATGATGGVLDSSTGRVDCGVTGEVSTSEVDCSATCGVLDSSTSGGSTSGGSTSGGSTSGGATGGVCCSSAGGVSESSTG